MEDARRQPDPDGVGEVYLGLKQGLIDAQENPFAISYHSKIYEVTKYLVLTHHAAGFFSFVLNDKSSRRYPPTCRPRSARRWCRPRRTTTSSSRRSRRSSSTSSRRRAWRSSRRYFAPFRERIKTLDAQFPEYAPWLAKIRGL